MARPANTPPIARMAKSRTASPASKNPLRVAATAQRNKIRPVASFSRLSPSSKAVSRRGSVTPLSTARADTASGGDTMAPNAKQAAQGSSGTSQCVTTPMVKVVNTTAPIASDRMPGK
jgi:hypothetical protein